MGGRGCAASPCMRVPLVETRQQEPASFGMDPDTAEQPGNATSIAGSGRFRHHGLRRAKCRSCAPRGKLREKQRECAARGDNGSTYCVHLLAYSNSAPRRCHKLLWSLRSVESSTEAGTITMTIFFLSIRPILPKRHCSKLSPSSSALR